MRAIPCDARYVRVIEAAITVALTDIRDDSRRRAQGRKPKIDDAMIDPTATGHALIVVGVTDENLPAALETLNPRAVRETSPL